MEVLGAVASGITLAGLLKVCIEAFDLIQVGRKQEIDYMKLALRLNLERARLYTWGEAMGLTVAASGDDLESQNRLYNSPFLPLIRNTLYLIVHLFEDGKKLQQTYGCAAYNERDSRGRPTETTVSNAVDLFSTSFAHFRVRGDQLGNSGSSIVNKTRWTIQDRKKFDVLVGDVRDLINSLQDITKSLSEAARQESVIRQTVQRITNPETLDMIAEVCQKDYPHISEVASVQLESVSLRTDRRRSIEAWMSSADPVGVFDDGQDLEDLNNSELRELVRRMRAEMAQKSSPELRASRTGESEAQNISAEASPPTQQPQTESNRDDNISLSSGSTPSTDVGNLQKNVTHLLTATKQMLETLTHWSRHQATDYEVSDVYVRMGYEFNLSCRAFQTSGIPTDDLGPVPDHLRSVLEELLTNEPSTEILDKYLPRVRDIIINMLQGLKSKQSRLRNARSNTAPENP